MMVMVVAVVRSAAPGVIIPVGGWRKRCGAFSSCVAEAALPVRVLPPPVEGNGSVRMSSASSSYSAGPDLAFTLWGNSWRLKSHGYKVRNWQKAEEVVDTEALQFVAVGGFHTLPYIVIK